MERLKDKLMECLGVYRMPNKFSFRTMEEFCDLNNLDIDNMSEDVVNFFYDNLDVVKLPNCNRDLMTHNEWILESLKSHHHKHLIHSVEKIFGDDLLKVSDVPSQKKLNNRDLAFVISTDTGIFSNNRTKLSDSPLSKKLYKVLDFHNYYISTIEHNSDYGAIYVEPLYTEDATQFVKDNGGIVYHITDRKYLDKILRTGLRPKVSNAEKGMYRYFTERVFLISHSEDIEEDIENVIYDTDIQDYVILKIDVSKLNITFWFDDASEGNTIYTYESIPPKFISVISEEEITTT